MRCEAEEPELKPDKYNLDVYAGPLKKRALLFYAFGRLSRDGFFSRIQNLVPKLGSVSWRANCKELKINIVEIGPWLEMILSVKNPANEKRNYPNHPPDPRSDYQCNGSDFQCNY
jgi:hypothetical protein